MSKKNVGILLVADNATDVELALHAFHQKKLANRIEVARGGEEVLDVLFCRGRYANRHSADTLHMVLLDLRLPKVTGMEILRDETDAADAKPLPLITLTASREEKDPAATPALIEGMLNDISKRKKIEEAFRQSQQMESMGRLASGITHDFNNLLMVINDCCNRLKNQLDDSEGLCRTANEIQKTAERAASLTGQLLAFSRRQVPEAQILEPNQALASMDEMLRRLVGEGIELLTACRPEVGQVKADPGQLEQVILNLVVNARDAMPQGGKLIIETANVELDETYAQAHAGVQPGSYVMLAVSDTGCGMDAETQTRIFEPFFTTKGQGKGTGLGLAIVDEIVRKNGGFIAVYSKPELGTTVKVFLPRYEEETKAARPHKPPRQTARGSETVLLVEDQKAVRAILCTILQRNGYTVLEANDGADAIHISEQQPGPIHLILTDVFMPDMNGRELAARLASVRPDMKVLYMSGHTHSAIVHNGMLNPDATLIQKPFSPNDLARKVREVLEEVRTG